MPKNYLVIVFFVLTLIAGALFWTLYRPSDLNTRGLLQPERTTKALAINGYGYEIGDVVEISNTKPRVDDVILFDPFENKSMCGGFGPRMALGKVIGVPGNIYSFDGNKITIEDKTITIDEAFLQIGTAIGGEKYAKMNSLTNTLESNEYLMDRRVGQECFPGEVDEFGSSITYNRFTVYDESLIGVVIQKVGHDDQAEEMFKNVIY